MTEKEQSSEQPITTATVSDLSRDHTLRKFFRNKLVIGAIAVVVVVGIAVAVFFVAHKRPSSSTSNQTNFTEAPSVLATNKAQDLAAQGNYSQAQSNLDANIAAAKTAKDKGALVEGKALVAYNEGKYQDALTYAQQAESLNATQNSAYLLAISYEALGNKQQAVVYYQKAIDRTADVIKNGSPDIIDGYNAKIKELSQ